MVLLIDEIKNIVYLQFQQKNYKKSVKTYNEAICNASKR